MPNKTSGRKPVVVYISDEIRERIDACVATNKTVAQKLPVTLPEDVLPTTITGFVRVLLTGYFTADAAEEYKKDLLEGLNTLQKEWEACTKKDCKVRK
jgi:hypothetical protein